MPRINNSVLWFDDMRFTNEGVFDTPFGRVSVRQLIILGVFALPAWIIFTGLEGVDMMLRVLAAGSIFLFGAILATWRVKTVPPERILLLALGFGRREPRRAAAEPSRKPNPKAETKPVEARAEAKMEKRSERGAERLARGRTHGVIPIMQAAPPVKATRVHAVVGEAVKITGVLRDPQTGMPLPNRQYSVIVDGMLRYRRASDETGAFDIVYLPERPGIVKIAIAPDGCTFMEEVEVEVEPPR